jgi:hypothetical protein
MFCALSKCSKLYSEKETQFIEGDVFKIVIPNTQHVTPHAAQQVDDKIGRLMEFKN